MPPAKQQPRPTVAGTARRKGKTGTRNPVKVNSNRVAGTAHPEALLPDGLLLKAVLGLGIVLAVGGLSFFLVGKRQTPARRKMAIGFLMVGTLLMLGSAWYWSSRTALRTTTS